MPYIIDWADPSFPRIRAASSGDSLDTVVTIVIRHHLEIIKAHCRAVERVLNDVQS
jgi:hypothetical protein